MKNYDLLRVLFIPFNFAEEFSPYCTYSSLSIYETRWMAVIKHQKRSFCYYFQFLKATTEKLLSLLKMFFPLLFLAFCMKEKINIIIDFKATTNAIYWGVSSYYSWIMQKVLKLIEICLKYHKDFFSIPQLHQMHFHFNFECRQWLEGSLLCMWTRALFL